MNVSVLYCFVPAFRLVCYKHQTQMHYVINVFILVSEKRKNLLFVLLSDKERFKQINKPLNSVLLQFVH